MSNLIQSVWRRHRPFCRIAVAVNPSASLAGIRLAGIGLILSLLASPRLWAEDQVKPEDDLLFYVSFDGGLQASLFQADGGVYTADSAARKLIEPGNQIPQVTIASGAGKRGDALRFSARTEKVLCYKAASNGFEPKDNWSGTVSFWLKLTPDTDLPAGYCDPLQITSKKWDDASFFVDFDQTLPRDFRLGVFSDFDFWNPEKTKWDDVAVADRPMVVVKEPAFSRDQWTHVVFTFENLNSTTEKPSLASLYVNGKHQGSVRKPIRFTWEKSAENSNEAMIMLGINYVGDLDELAIYKRALSSDEVQQLFLQP